MRELHLFAGAGGGILGGLLLGHVPVGAVEFDAYCRRVLEARQADGCLPPFPIHDDVRTFDGKPWRGKVDVVCGGFPCQPWSSAGKQLGADDPRHLWPEMARIIEEVRPRYVFAENVSLAAFAEPWRDLRGLGYRVPPAICVAAADVGAPHLRKRWWLLAADARGDAGWGEQVQSPECQSSPIAVHDGAKGRLADAKSLGRRSGRPRGVAAHGEGRDATGAADGNPNRNGQPAIAVDDEAPRLPGVGDSNNPGRAQQRRAEPARTQHQAAQRAGWWSTEPRFRRVAHGVPNRVAQLRALGNAQVPSVAATAFGLLMDQLGECVK